MDFDEALELAARGHVVARKAWSVERLMRCDTTQPMWPLYTTDNVFTDEDRWASDWCDRGYMQ